MNLVRLLRGGVQLAGDGEPKLDSGLRRNDDDWNVQVVIEKSRVVLVLSLTD